MRTKRFMYFCSKKYIGTQGEVCRLLKYFNPPKLVYDTEAMVPVLFCVAL